MRQEPPLSFVLSERGQRGGRGADDDVSDVPQEGLCRRRSREEGKQVGGGEGWRERRGTYDQIGRLTRGTNPKAKGVGSGGTGGGTGEGGETPENQRDTWPAFWNTEG